MGLAMHDGYNRHRFNRRVPRLGKPRSTGDDATLPLSDGQACEPGRGGRLCRSLALAVTFSLIGFAASAEESMFGFVYTTDLLPQDAKEVEQ